MKNGKEGLVTEIMMGSPVTLKPEDTLDQGCRPSASRQKNRLRARGHRRRYRRNSDDDGHLEICRETGMTKSHLPGSSTLFMDRRTLANTCRSARNLGRFQNATWKFKTTN